MNMVRVLRQHFIIIIHLYLLLLCEILLCCALGYYMDSKFRGKYLQVYIFRLYSIKYSKCLEGKMCLIVYITMYESPIASLFRYDNIAAYLLNPFFSKSYRFLEFLYKIKDLILKVKNIESTFPIYSLFILLKYSQIKLIYNQDVKYNLMHIHFEMITVIKSINISPHQISIIYMHTYVKAV